MYLKRLTIAIGLCFATAMSAQDGWTKLVIKGVGPQKQTYVITNDK